MRTQEATRTWLRCFQARPAARRRLVCFPHAGGNATFYRTWAAGLPSDTEVLAVQYPGRLDRASEPCVTDMDELVSGITSALEAVLDRDVALFGHSMGGAVAYEVATRIEYRLRIPLARLFVSGRPAPRHHQAGGVKHQGPDETLWAEMRRLGGTAEDVLRHADLRAAVLPALRGDYRLIENYRPAARPPLPVPITVFTGDHDPEVTVAEAEDWRTHTAGGFDLGVFPGDHFYLVDQRDAVLRRISGALRGEQGAV